MSLLLLLRQAAASVPKVSTLVDAFDTDNTTLWENFPAGSHSIVAGAAQASPAGTAYVNRASRARYDLTESFVYTDLTLLNGKASSEGYLQINASAGNSVQIGASTGSIICRQIVGGTSTDTYPVGPGAATKYMGIRHSGGTVTWETSPDGVTWTVRRTSAAPPAGLNSVLVQLTVGQYAVETANATFRWGGLNAIQPSDQALSLASVTPADAVGSPALTLGQAPGLPGLIDGVEPEAHGHNPPFADGNGNLYRIVEEYPAATQPVNPNTPRMMKSGNGGITWAEVDAANRPTDNDVESGWCVQADNRIYFSWTDGAFVSFCAFNTSDHPTAPDTWAIKNEKGITGLAAPSQQHNSMVRLSDGRFRVFMSDTGTTTQHNLAYITRAAAGGWSAKAVLASGGNHAGAVSIADANNVTHVFYQDIAARTILYRTLGADDVLSAAVQVSVGTTNTATRNYNAAGNPVAYTASGSQVVAAMYAASSGTRLVQVVNGTVTDELIDTANPLISPAGTGANTGNDGPVLHLAVHGTTLHAVFAEASTGSVVHRSRPHGGAWSARTVLWAAPAGNTASWLYSNVITHGGSTVLGYTYDLGPNVDADGNIQYNQLVLGAAPGPQQTLAPTSVVDGSLFGTPTLTAGAAPIFADDFNRPDGPLGANWNTAGSSPYSIVSGQVHTNGTAVVARWAADAPGTGAMFSQATYVGGPTNGVSVAMPTIAPGNISTTGAWYWFHQRTATGGIAISRKDAGVSSTTTLVTNARNLVAGDVIRLEYDGTTLTGKINGVTVLSTAPAAPLTGQRGVGFSGNNTQSIPVLDDWSGGAVAATTGDQAISVAATADPMEVGTPTVVATAPSPTLTIANQTAGTGAFTTHNVPLGSGWAGGDLVVLFATMNTSTGTINSPSGWNVAMPETASAGTTSSHMAIFWKPWDASMTAQTLTSGGTGRWAVAVGRLRYADPGAPFVGLASLSPGAGSTTTVTAPTQTSTTSPLLATVYAARSNVNDVQITWTAPAGMTEIADISSTATGTTNATISVHVETIAVGSTTGPRVATADPTTTGSRGVSFTVAPAPVGTGVQTLAVAEVPSAEAVGASTVRRATPEGRLILWEDHFDGPAGSAPDPAYWTAQTGGGGWGNAELQTYTTAAANLALDGAGNLAITAVRDAGGNYTSGRIRSLGKAQYAHGRFEARIAFPAGTGLWPAWWMMGDEGVHGQWPQNGEIDVMEAESAMTTFYGTLHGPMTSAPTTPYHYGKTRTGMNLGDGQFHTYAVEWNTDEVHWFADGRYLFSIRPADLPAGSTWVFNDRPFHMLLNLAVGGAFTNNVTPDPAAFPATMRVDYARVLEPAPYTPAPAKVGTLTDTFATEDRFLWAGYDGPSIEASGGRLRMQPTTGYPSLFTQDRYDLTGSAVSVELVTPPTGATSSEVTFQVIQSPDNLLLIGRTGSGGLVCRSRAGGVNSDTYPTYDETAMRYWRIREAAGTVYWETSPNGTTWTVRRSLAAAFTADSALVQFTAGYWDGAQTQPTVAEFDNLNLVGAPPTITLSLTAAGSAELAGAPSVAPGQVVVAPAGVLDTHPAGTPALAPGAVTLAPAGTTDVTAAGTPTLAPGAVTVNLTGIADAPAAGAPTVTPGQVALALTGVDDPSAVGAVSLAAGQVTIGVTGVASGEAHGAAALAPGQVALAPTGVLTAQAYGSPTLTAGPAGIAVSGVPPGELVGAQVVTAGGTLLAPTAVGTAEQAGAPTLTPGAVALAPAGVASDASIPSPALAAGAVTVAPTPISSAQALGAPALTVGTTTVLAPSVLSAEAPGVPLVAVAGVNSVAPAGVATGQAVPGPSLATGAVSVTLTGVPTGQAFGAPTVAPGAVTVSPAAIGSAQALGAPAVTAGGTAVSPTAVPSAFASGTLAVARGAVTVALLAVPSAGVVPSVAVGRGAVTVAPAGIVSGAQVGAARVGFAVEYERVYRPGRSTLDVVPVGTSTLDVVQVGLSTLTASPAGMSTVTAGQVGLSTVTPVSTGTSTVTAVAAGTSTVEVPAPGTSTVETPAAGSSTLTVF